MLREGLAECCQLLRTLSSFGQSHAHPGADARALRDASLLLAPSMSAPVDVLVGGPEERSASLLVRPRLCSGSEGEPSYSVAPAVSVVTPQLAVQQLAARASLVRTVMLVTEMLGRFAVYRPPEPMRDLLEELLERGGLPSLSGWSPSLDADGHLTTLWSRPPLLTPGRLLAHANQTKVTRGRKRLELAARLAIPGAASPLEVRAGILMGFPHARGGEGYGGLSHNVRVDLTGEAKRLARRGHLVCDLYWQAKEGRRALDLECQSVQAHSGAASALTDADRATALQLVGTEVVFATHGQISDPERFDALSKVVAEKLGVSYHLKSPEQRERAGLLRQEVLQNWEGLPFV